jgi:hypothetical protein
VATAGMLAGDPTGAYREEVFSQHVKLLWCTVHLFFTYIHGEDK